MATTPLTDTLRETLAVFDGPTPGEPLTTTEVAQRLDLGRRSTYARLERLAERDLVETKKVGARGRVWWRPAGGAAGSGAADGSVGDGIREELEHVFDRVDDAFWALDEAFRFTYINDRAEEILETSRKDLFGRNVWEALPWLAELEAKENFEEAMATGETRYFEDYVEATGRWYDVRVYPSESGLSVYYQDVTERKERERELAESERLKRAIVENFPNGVVGLFDRDLRHVVVGGEVSPGLDITAEEMEGQTLEEIFPRAPYAVVEPHFRAVFEGESRTFEVELGDEVRLFRTHPVRDDDGEIVAGLGMSQDVTDRRERERELERYETIVETVGDGIYAVDEDGRFELVNEAFCSMVGYGREEILGRHAASVHDAEIDRLADRLASEVAAGDRDLASLEVDIRTRSGETLPVESRFAPYPLDDGYGRCGVVRDMTERIERERELERYVSIVDAVGEPAYELDARGNITFVNDAMVEYSGYEEDELLGAHPSIIMDEEAVARAESHIVDLLADDEAVTSALEYEIVTKDGERVPVENRLSVRTDEDGRFTGSSGLIWDVSERLERERELERQRNRLEALNDLNGVVREITDAVIEQSTREQIERIVCERLAATDSYTFAWIGDVEGHSGRVIPRAEAGVEGYLDEVTISVDPEDPRSAGPTGRALLERDIQVTQDVRSGSSHDPWREAIAEYGFRSSAAIPIVHEDTLFGVLNVYADRPEAFTEDEQAVVGALGEVVGHVIAAAERKRALMSDEVVELQFRIRDVFGTLDLPLEDGTVTLERTVPLGDGSYLVYGTAAGDSIAAVEAMVETPELAHWKSLNVISSRGGETRFEVAMDRPPVLSTVASLGGRIDASRIEDGDFHMTVHLAPSADVRRVVDAVERTYPATVMTTRRQVTRGEGGRTGPLGSPLAELTDRQRAAVETAFYSGYFGWPRDSNGGDVAASLGIDPSTFHHHLRAAERKILASVLGAEARG